MIVPGNAQAPKQDIGPKVDPTYLLMAAATMHEQGRLFEPNQPMTDLTKPQDKQKEIETLTRERKGGVLSPSDVDFLERRGNPPVITEDLTS